MGILSLLQQVRAPGKPARNLPPDHQQRTASTNRPRSPGHGTSFSVLPTEDITGDPGSCFLTPRGPGFPPFVLSSRQVDSWRLEWLGSLLGLASEFPVQLYPYCSFLGSPRLCPPSRATGDVARASDPEHFLSPASYQGITSPLLQTVWNLHPPIHSGPAPSSILALSLITHRVTSLKGAPPLTITSAQRSEPRPRGDGRFLSPHVVLSSQRAFMAFRGHAVRPRPFALTVLFLERSSLAALPSAHMQPLHICFSLPTKIPIPCLRVSFSLQ